MDTLVMLLQELINVKKPVHCQLSMAILSLDYVLLKISVQPLISMLIDILDNVWLDAQNIIKPSEMQQITNVHKHARG